ncbi:Uncharacterised protein [Mycobacteroides abscessus subsp. abscessus]|nr:Uncharacterised protein [Mycobacteroides abscessus subsp. abscessus]SKU74617.1 Uncharacterised protein [Mycobacteroides abscessus subsp. abscessus]SLD06307.1 Uncharacterised protein [Mycobacteroides abscessus subsp. massiliense]
MSLRSLGSSINGPVSAEALVVGRIDSTPAGSPASANTWPSSSMVSGVSAAGLTIMVHPAASAGPILRVPMASGKFHGVMASVGPMGCLVTRIRPAPVGDEVYRPLMRTASSENQRRNSPP